MTTLTNLMTLGLSFATWTLDQPVADLYAVKGVAIQRSRLDDLLLREGLRWRRHETRFGERVDW